MAEEKSRTLKLSILGDVDNLLDAFKKAEKATNNHVDDLKDYAKKAALAFAAVGAAASAFAVSSIKNALEDQAAQRKLEETLKATTSATESQIAAVGKWIDKTSIAIGVTDDALRPALSRLVRSTNDVGAAQELLNLALDITAATGKPLETVANALGKAYDGNSASLGRLGLGLDSSILKSKDFNAIYQSLTKTFGNFAENEAETTNKKFERLKIALDEAKESIGAALLPAVEKLANFLIKTGIPMLEAFVGGLTGTNGLVDGATKGEKQAYEFGQQLKSFIKIIVDLKEEILLLAGVMGTVFVATKIAAFVSATAAAIKGLIAVYNALKVSAFVAGVASYFALNPLAGIAAAAVGTAVMAAAAKAASSFGGGDVDISGIIGSSGGAGGSTGSSFAGGGAGGGGFSSAGGVGVGSSQTISSLSKGLITSEKDLVDQLTNVSEKLADISFAYETGQLTKSQASVMLAEQQKQFEKLTAIADALQAKAATQAINTADAARGQAAANYYITLNAPIATEEAAKVIVDTITESANRGGAASGLAAKLANLP